MQNRRLATAVTATTAETARPPQTASFVTSVQGNDSSTSDSLSLRGRRFWLWNGSGLLRKERKSTCSTVPMSSRSFKALSSKLRSGATGLKSFDMDDDPSARSVTSELRASSALNDSSTFGIDNELRHRHEPKSSPTVEVTGLRKGSLKILSHEESLERSYRTSDAQTTIPPSPRDSSSRQSRKRSVSFSTVHIHFHSRILGDNPSVSSGPPIALGDSLGPAPDPLGVDEYESLRDADDAPPRRRQSELLLGRMDREDLLKECGYSRSDFFEAEREVRKLKAQRQASARLSRVERFRTRVRNLFARTASGVGRPLSPPSLESWQKFGGPKID
jgi:hypothetical protein